MELHLAEGPSTQYVYVRTLVPNTIKTMVFGTRDLNYWVLGPSGPSFALMPSVQVVLHLGGIVVEMDPVDNVLPRLLS